MTKKILFIFLLIGSFVIFSQETIDPYEIKQQRSFNEDLPSKYNGKDFQYSDYNVPKKKKATKANENQNNKGGEQLFKALVSFMGSVFPYLLAVIVIIIIVKSVLAGDNSLWNFGKNKTIASNVSIITDNEEELIDSNDFSKLLALAKKEGDFRKATKYYYLLLLKKMSEKEFISFDKDKTNTEYIFELKKTELRKQFSYLLYIYDYVWYGEFAIDTASFKTIEQKYQSFLKSL